MYEDQNPMVSQQNPMISIQETYPLSARVTTRATYDEPHEICPRGTQQRECKRTKLRGPPPVPYIPEKDKVQEEVSKLCQLQINSLLEKDTTLNFLVWQENGTREAFLMHVTAVLDAMKKRGHFNKYNRSQKAYVEAAKAAEFAEVGLALL